MSSSRSPDAAPADAADAVDRTASPQAGERFRSALRTAGKTDPAAERTDDTTATAATQAAYLARAAGLRDTVDAAAPRRDVATGAPDAASATALRTRRTSGLETTIAELIARGTAATEGPQTDTGPATRPAASNDATTVDAHIQLGLLAGAAGRAIAIPVVRSAHPSAAALRATGSNPHAPAGDDLATAMLRAAYAAPTGDASAAAAPTGDASAVAPLTGDASAAAAPLCMVDPALADSPVAAWRAAAVGRAISSAGSAVATANANDDDAKAPAGPVAPTVAPTDSPGLGSPASELTPLEQAVRDLVDRIVDRPDRSAERNAGRPHADAGVAGLASLAGLEPSRPAAARDAVATPGAPSHAAAAHATRQPAEPPADPSHVHLVIDDGPERVVATVAVRGGEVHVSLRATDDATAAALARNAGSLEHAMRTRGLDLGQLTSERGPHDQRPSQNSGDSRDTADARDAQSRRRPRDAQRFDLEDKP